MGVVGVIVLAFLVTAGLAAISDMPSGYGAAQSRDQTWLDAHAGQWSLLRQGTTRDLVRFIPGYLVFGVVLIGAVALTRRGGEPGLNSGRVRGPALIALCLLVIGAIADVLETLLFRHSLTRLIVSSGRADVGTSTSITLVMTVVKWTALVGFFLTLVAMILRQPAPRHSDR
jgi:hypothetical protein